MAVASILSMCYLFWIICSEETSSHVLRALTLFWINPHGEEMKLLVTASEEVRPAINHMYELRTGLPPSLCPPVGLSDEAAAPVNSLTATSGARH